MSIWTRQMIYTATTHSVKVSVKTRFEDHLSDADKLNFIFSYKVLIENLSSSPIKLMRRHWHIVDSLHINKEVEGNGVIGEQPTIEPGQHHHYESWCSLKSEAGKMWGTYLFLNTETNVKFDVNIPEFHLFAPHLLN
jgi:ApaG protein